jgi:diaminohydroxyphosphoribosylaminopyrimidine deaminase/5-amino-6-(5-phosphoribosylamino)uracil reductase
MCLLPADEPLLSRALDLAAQAVGLASPNPTVGCVIARGETILGEGAHHYDQFDHAEIVALKQAASRGEITQGATAYVTLEPCSHHGRTGPCADALAAAGIARCIIATVDPNPLVSGKGIAKLRAAGVEVFIADPSSTLAQQARRLNDAFAFSIQHGRPFVTLKAAVSLDGMIAPATRTVREPVWLTGPAARADVQQLRHASDAILTGIGTILADDPSLTDRTQLPRRRPLLRIVLDSRLRTQLDSKIAHTIVDDLLLFTSEEASSETESLFREMGANVVRIPQQAGGALDLNEALQQLHHRNIRSVLLEGGSALNGAFLQAGLVDRVVLYFSEFELGLDAIPFALEQPSPYVLVEQLHSITRTEIPHTTGSTLEDICITGYLHEPWNLNPGP